MRTANRTRRSFRNAIDSLEARRLMATFAVTSANDSGLGSLRAAINSANASNDADVIQFAIPGAGPHTITLQSSLIIDSPVTIDAATQPGYAGAPRVRLDGANANGYGMYVNASNVTVRGLSITRFGNPAIAGDGNGIIGSGANLTVERCYIGIAPNGDAAPNEGNGISLSGGSNGTAIRNNVIGSNAGNGVFISGLGIQLTGNYIGTDPSGNFARPNGQHGVSVGSGATASIGDAGDANRNVISGNALSGIFFTSSSPNTLIINNYIGTTAAGNGVLANGDYGVTLTGSSSVNVGYPGIGNRFGGDGVYLTGNANGNFITENVFGLGVNNTFDVGDTVAINVDAGGVNEITNNLIGRVQTGIRVVGSSNFITGNQIGTTPSGLNTGGTIGISVNGANNIVRDNVVQNQASVGVWVIAGSGNVLENRTFANQQSVWVSGTANDSMPVPTILSTAEHTDGTFKADVTVPAVPQGLYTLFFYESDTAGLATSGHTQRLIQALTISAPNNTAQNKTYFLPGLNRDGRFLSISMAKMVSSSLVGSTGQPSAAVEFVGSPVVYDSGFDVDPKQSIQYTFSDNVGATLSASDLTIRNALSWQTVTASSFVWDAGTKTARWTFNNPLPDGKYESFFAPGAFSNAYGPNKQDFKLTFHSLAGDANRDGTVNFDDLLILASNYNSTSKSFKQGNFSYDANGTVNFDDLLILAANYNKSIALGAPAPLVAPVGGSNDDDSTGNDVLA